MQENISHGLLKYLKQENLSTVALLPAMQQLQGGMDGILSRTDLGEDEKAKQFLQLQTRYLTFKQQLNANTLLPDAIRPEEMNTSQPNSFNITTNLNQAAILQTPKAVVATPPPLNPPMPAAPKRKRQRIHFLNNNMTMNRLKLVSI